MKPIPSEKKDKNSKKRWWPEQALIAVRDGGAQKSDLENRSQTN